MQLVTIVQVIGVSAALGGLGLCVAKVVLERRIKERSGVTKIWVLSASSVILVKWLAFGGLFAAPAVTSAMAYYHVFEGTKEVKSCARCHVMEPIVDDMMDPASTTLAARHYRHSWIGKKQCHTCHTDYGLHGSLKAKTDGFRHLVKYVTGTYKEPVEYRGRYNNANCLQCHAGTEAFARVSSHMTVIDRLTASSMSCTNCHGPSHRR